MSYRQICITLLSSAFLLGSTPALQAMEHDEDSSSSTSYHCPPPEITPEDRQFFKIIESAKNMIPETNSDLDEIQLLLKAPIKAELPFGKYLYLKNPDEYEGGANRTIFMAILENGIKVFIKRSIDIYHEDLGEFIKHYDVEGAIPELVAPKIARAYFDEPTLPPTEFIAGDHGQFEVRQFFIKGALPEKMDEKWEEVLYRTLMFKPQLFNRPPNFLLDLGLFDDFIAAADRNPTNYLWVPCQKMRNKQQKLAFFAIDYQETYYSLENDLIIKEVYDETGPCILPLEIPVAPLSALKKLEYLHKIYPTFIKEAKGLHPLFTEENNDLYDSRYFVVMQKWQQDLLKFYQGNTVDDTNATWGIMVNSHELNKK